MYEKVTEEINEKAAADDRKNIITHSQVRNKFKKLVRKYKSISPTQQTACGISCYKVEKGHGKRWNILFSLVASRDSEDPSNTIEP